jgi:hypothetical protein
MKDKAHVALTYFINYCIATCQVSSLNVYLDTWLKIHNGKAYPTL